MDIIERMQQDYVVITPGNWVFKADFRALVNQHIESGADVTLLYHRTEKGDTEYRACNVLELNRQKGVNQIKPNDGSKPNCNVFMDTFIMKKDTFIDLINEAMKRSSIFGLVDILNQERDVLDIRGIQHKGSYVACIYDVRSYYESNMALLDYSLASKLFTSDWPIYTQTTDSCPVHYFKGAVVKNSMIANGCNIRGTVENSIIGRGVEIGEGAVVKDSLVLGHSVIGKGVHIGRQIIDKWAQVLNVKDLVSTSELPGYIRRNDII